MSSIARGPVAERWDAEYRRGRYLDDPPIPFVGRILAALRADDEVLSGPGLYVGCGNGRNFLPLVDTGLDLWGLDISHEALRQLAAKRPDLKLLRADFSEFHARTPLAYLIAIQVFQHGSEADIARNFEKVRTLVQPGGLFCLRVNSVATDIRFAHTVADRNRFGGFTLRYEDGYKKGLAIHFATKEELHDRMRAGWEPVSELEEQYMEHDRPDEGHWAQWEGIWRRTA